MPLRILITNNTLAGRAGTELYVRDVACELLARGHQIVAYSTVLGEVAEELHGATIPVIDRLDGVSVTPEVIHGHHHLETMTALLQYPEVPAIYFCHGWLPFEERAPKFPRILRYVAVDETCRDRLIYENNIPADRVRMLLNFVDLKRFKPRGPLPNKPKRALVFSNGTNEHNILPAIRAACARFEITVDAVGQGVGNPTAQPENLLANYDLVFGKARAALEALAVGASVIACDTVGAGPLVTPHNVAALRQLNFGIRALRHRVDVEHIAGEIARYDAHQAAEVSAWVRNNAGMDTAVDQLIKLYQEVIEEHRQNGRTDARLEMQAAAAYLRQWMPNLTSQHQAALQTHRDADVLLTRNARLNTDLSAALVNLAELHESSAMRLRNRLVSVPLIGRWVKSLARVAAARFGNQHPPKQSGRE